MSTHQSLLSQVCSAQSRNSTLADASLRGAASRLAKIAIAEDMLLMPADETGDRLIGAALVAHNGLALVDASRRLDGQKILLVAGHLAGAVGVSLRATVALKLGAEHIEAASLGGWANGIQGCIRVWDITDTDSHQRPTAPEDSTYRWRR